MRHSFRANRGGHRGAVLLMALLIMSQVLVAAMGLGSLTLNSLQQSRYIDNSIMAYYAAESGVEEALWEMRHGPTGKLPNSVSVPRKISNGATWTRVVRGYEPVVTVDIDKDSFVEIDLYDPDNPGEQLKTNTRFNRIDITWPIENCSPENCPNLVASLVSWSPDHFNAWSENAWMARRISSAVETSITIGVQPNMLHKLRLRAENGSFDDVDVTVANGESASDVPGRFVVESWGQYREAVQHILVKAPRQAPLAGLYEFAIFSECSLVKGFPIRCP